MQTSNCMVFWKVGGIVGCVCLGEGGGPPSNQCSRSPVTFPTCIYSRPRIFCMSPIKDHINPLSITSALSKDCIELRACLCHFRRLLLLPRKKILSLSSRIGSAFHGIAENFTSFDAFPCGKAFAPNDGKKFLWKNVPLCHGIFAGRRLH